nr:MAG TPA: hypothetical protein [Caudoviricetes sp.]
MPLVCYGSIVADYAPVVHTTTFLSCWHLLPIRHCPTFFTERM